jgi:hypothetical protein
MSWHYAVGSDQRGPVDDGELDRLVASGAVTPETLVWRAGMPGWQPLRAARSQALLAEAAQRSAAAPAIAAQPRPRPDAEAEFARVAGRRLAPLSAMQRGMALVFAQPGPAIGISALIMVLMLAAGFVPCIGSLVQLAVIGPLTAAWYGYFLRLIRRQPAGMDDVFAVFSSPDLMHMIAVHVVMTVLSLLVILPFVFAVFFTMIGTVAATAAAAEADAAAFAMGPLALVPMLAFLLVFAAMLYLTVAFMFALPLIHDRGHAFWPAMRLSQRVVHRQLLPMVGLVLLAGLVALAGLLALCLGIFVAMPIVMASYASAYDDLFGEAGAA